MPKMKLPQSALQDSMDSVMDPSVLDSPMRKLSRAILGFTGLNDPGTQLAMAAGPGPLIAKVPTAGRTSAMALKDLITRSSEMADGAYAPKEGSVGYAALEAFSKKYRRLMDHIARVGQEVDPQYMSTAIDGEPIEAAGLAMQANPAPGYADGRAGSIILHPKYSKLLHTYGTPPGLADDAKNTVAHEGAHVAQLLRLQDRAGRAGHEGMDLVNAVDDAYQAANSGPYFQQPAEIQARKSGNAFVLRHGGEIAAGPVTNFTAYPEGQYAGATNARKLAEAIARKDAGTPIPIEFDKFKKLNPAAADAARTRTKWP